MLKYIIDGLNLKSSSSSSHQSQQHISGIEGFLRLLYIWMSTRFLEDFTERKSDLRKRNTLSATAVECLNEIQKIASVFGKDCSSTIYIEVNRIKLLFLKMNARIKQRNNFIHQETNLSLLKNFDTKNLDKRMFSAFSAEVIASQLTLLEYSIFNAIELKEFHNKDWSSSDKSRAPTLRVLIARNNEIAAWVASCILLQKNDAARAKAATKCIWIAYWCYRLQNYNSMFSVLGGLQILPIDRIREILLRNMERKYIAVWRQLSDIIMPDKNYRFYRELLSKQTRAISEEQPILPYVGLFLKDLTMIEENPDYTNSPLLITSTISSFSDNTKPISGSVVVTNHSTFSGVNNMKSEQSENNQQQKQKKYPNMHKVVLIGNVLAQISKYQHITYNKRISTKITPLLQYLAACPHMNEEELYRISESVKPLRNNKLIEIEEPLSTTSSSSTISSGLYNDGPKQGSNSVPHQPPTYQDAPSAEALFDNSNNSSDIDLVSIASSESSANNKPVSDIEDLSTSSTSTSEELETFAPVGQSTARIAEVMKYVNRMSSF